MHTDHNFNAYGLSALILTEITQNNVEKIFCWALNRGVTIVVAKPNMGESDFCEIGTHLGAYAVLSQNEAGQIIVDGTVKNPLQSVLNREPNKPLQISKLEYDWSEDEIAFVLYTSGSTGKAKGVCHSLQSLIRSAEYFVTALNIKPHQTLLTFAPIDSIGAFKFIIISLLKRANALVVIPDGPMGWLKSLCSIKPDVLACSPQLLESAIKCEHIINAEDFSCIFYSGGALLADKTRKLFEATFDHTVSDGYGSTETGGAFWINTPSKDGVGFYPESSQVTSYSLHEISGNEGLETLHINCKSNFLCYLGSDRTLEQEYNTGDIVKKADGKIHLIGRQNRSFKSKDGLHILLSETLESHLKQNPDIKDAYVSSEYNTDLQPHVCYIDTNHDIDLILVKQGIIKHLGMPYARLTLTYGKINRNADGKIHSIFEHQK